MCNLSEGVYKRGIAEGIAKGETNGEIKGTLKMLKDFVTEPAAYVQKLVSCGINEQQYKEITAKYPELKPGF
jgi:hypothetical protein